jgi:hypothetical protein
VVAVGIFYFVIRVPLMGKFQMMDLTHLTPVVKGGGGVVAEDMKVMGNRRVVFVS